MNITQPSSLFDHSRNPVRVYCERCDKTHPVFRDEDECSPGSWREDSTGLQWQDFREAVYAADESPLRVAGCGCKWYADGTKYVCVTHRSGGVYP